MIPALIDVGGPWEVLPPGIHDATTRQIESRFATNPHRTRLFEGFCRALEALKRSGCSTVYLDGSFVTGKPIPGDYDACWDDSGVDARRLDNVLLDFTSNRRAQKAKYMGELLPASMRAAPGRAFIEFFQTDRHTGKRKGIIRVRL